MVRAEKMRRLAYEAKTPVLKGHLSH
jgi:hypothetical protein